MNLPLAEQLSKPDWDTKLIKLFDLLAFFFSYTLSTADRKSLFIFLLQAINLGKMSVDYLFMLE
jgi:hypothetical protein